MGPWAGVYWDQRVEPMTYIKTDSYRSIYGCEPHGERMWRFTSKDPARMSFIEAVYVALKKEVFSFRCSYTEARRAAVKWAKENNITILYLVA